MPATVIDGKALAAATKAEAAEKVRELKSRGINPCLAVILVGENPASQVYVRGKINDCAQCGIESRSINLPADTTQDTLLAEVKKLADDSAVHGILVQLPLPAQIDEKAVIDAIPPEKDVDGFSPVNVGRMQIGEPCYLPCTPAGSGSCTRMPCTAESSASFFTSASRASCVVSAGRLMLRLSMPHCAQSLILPRT